MSKRIGVDFDNTIIGYQTAFLAAARARGLIGPDFVGTKKEIRDAIRLLPEGELAWQRLQGFVYGQGLADAVLFEGVGSFMKRCRAEGHEVYIVSHKTEFGHFDPARVNLRHAARDWLQAQGFFAADGYGLPPENVFFESTRAEKLQRVRALGCTHFIDDLEEVFDDPEFPETTERILFSGEAKNCPYTICSSWRRVEEVVLDGRA